MTILPADWLEVRLGDVVDFLDGQRRPVKASDRSSVQGVIPYYGASGIVDFVNDYIFDEDLILLGEDGENILSRNTRLAFKVTGKVWVNNHAHVLRPRTGVCLDYLVEYLEAQDYAKYNSGTAQPKLNKVACTGIPVVLPPLKEQEAIAEALNDADAAIESLDTLIAKKRDVKQATMQQLLTGRTRLSGFSDTWKVEPLDGHVSMLKGKGLSRSKLSDSGKFKALLYGELFTVYGRVIRSVNSRTDSDEGIASLFGDVLMPGSTTTTGEDLATASALLQNDVRIGGDVNIIRPDLKMIDPSWLAYRITNCHRRDVGSITQGITIHHLYGRDIASLLIPFPALVEQKAIVEILTKMDDELEALNEQDSKLRMVKEGMMQDLLTGKVRLV